MKNKTKTVILLLAIIMMAFLFFFPISSKTIIGIKANFENTITQVQQPENWLHWHLALKAFNKNNNAYKIKKNSLTKTVEFILPTQQIVVHTLAPLHYEVTEIQANKKSGTYHFVIIPSTATDSITVVVESRQTMAHKLLHKQNNFEKNIYSLKNFLETPLLLYGFPIKIRPVEDTVFLTMQTIVSKNNLYGSLPLLFQEMEAYAHKNKVAIVNHKMLSVVEAPTDSFKITAGLPVAHAVPNTNAIACVRMPKGKLLTGIYKGSFRHRDSLYKAMDAYLIDHFLERVALPFDRFLNNSLPQNDSSMVHVETCYPIW